MSTPRVQVGLLGLLFVLPVLDACGEEPRRAPIPRVDLSGVDPDLAERLSAAIHKVEEDPSSQHWFELAMYYDANDLWESAASAYAVPASRPASAYVAKSTYHLGRMRENLGQLDDALACYASAELLAPDFLPAIWRQGEVLVSLGLLAEARGMFLRALERQPDDSASLLGLARIQLTLGEPQAAVDTLERLVESQPRIRFAHNLLVRAYSQLDRPGRAKRSAAREKRSGDAVYKDPWLSEVRKHRVGEGVLLEEAGAALAAGDTASALAILEPLHREHPESLPALRLLLEALNRERRFDETLAIMRSAEDQHGEHHLLLIPTGRALQGLKRADEAIPKLRRAIALAPGYAQGHIALGEALLYLGRNEQAVVALESAYELGDMNVRDWVLLARALASIGAHERTAVYMRKAIEDFPVSPDIWLRLAEALIHVGKLVEARDALAKVEERDPENEYLPRVRAQLGAAPGADMDY